MSTAAVIIGAQSFLLSVAIAVIAYQWFCRRPSAISERLDELDKQVDFLTKVNAQIEIRQDLVAEIGRNCGCIEEDTASLPTTKRSDIRAIQGGTA